MKKLMINMVSLVFSHKYDDYYASTNINTKCEFLQHSNICAFNPKNNQELYCFTSEGDFYTFDVNYETKVIKKSYECNMDNIIN